MVQIEKNDYVHPTEVREEIVQGICDAFLAGTAFSIMNPRTVSLYRRRTLLIIRHKGGKYYGFSDIPLDDECERFNGAEMKEAFRVLREAGYHIFWVEGVFGGYKVGKRPVMDGCHEVTEFSHFID